MLRRLTNRYIFLMLRLQYSLALAGVLLLITPMSIRAAPADGSALFTRHCAACHGSRGEGGVGVPLSLPSFIDSVDDPYLKKTIRYGRSGRVMPAFKQLKDAEIDAIVTHMRTWTGHRPRSFSTKRVKGDNKHGQELYLKYCAACHGDHGQGGRGTGVTMSRPRDLPIIAPALNNPGFLKAVTDAMIKNTLMRGRVDTPMTSFLKAGLTEKDINDIVAFVRSFEAHPLAESARVLSIESPIIMRESPYGLTDTVEKLKNAVKGANMRLIRVQYLDQGLVPEGQENKNQVIVYSCNFNFLYDALKVDTRVGLFLPCRVTVVQHGDKVLVMSINPKRLSALYNNSELNRLCQEMYQIYANIIEEATF
jgi:cytochrome c oxidase cbb3-type subunit III